MKRLLENKVAVITGAGSPCGIGRATARLFVSEGARVAILDVNESGLTETLNTLAGGHMALPCDVTQIDDCRTCLDEVAKRLNGVDILVNNAGVVYSTALESISEAEYEQVLDVNLKGSFLMSQAAVPHLRSRGGGAIVCVSSIAGRVGGGVFGTSHYAVAKSGVFGLAKALARELAPLGIRSNAIAPGPIDNDFTGGRMTEEMKAELAKRVPLGRLGTSEDVACAALFLASEMSAWITGTVIDVNGGLLIH